MPNFGCAPWCSDCRVVVAVGACGDEHPLTLVSMFLLLLCTGSRNVVRECFVKGAPIALAYHRASLPAGLFLAPIAVL